MWAGPRASIYTEAVSLDGVPAPLQDIAHNPGNKLSSKKTATFAAEQWGLDAAID